MKCDSQLRDFSPTERPILRTDHANPWKWREGRGALTVCDLREAVGSLIVGLVDTEAMCLTGLKIGYATRELSGIFARVARLVRGWLGRWRMPIVTGVASGYVPRPDGSERPKGGTPPEAWRVSSQPLAVPIIRSKAVVVVAAS